MIPLIVPYTQLKPETRASLLDQDVTYVDVSYSDDGYYWALQGAWHRGEGILIVEHDIVPDPGCIDVLRACPEPWCGFTYQVGINIGSWLGCTKFTPELMARYPDAINHMERTDWKSIDGQLLPYLRSQGEHVHKHWPAVRHLNGCGDEQTVLYACPCGGPIRFEQVRGGPNTVVCPRCQGYVNYYSMG